jgi:hypothetical protein
MNKTHILCFFAVALTVSACSSDAPTSKQTASEQAVATDMPASPDVAGDTSTVAQSANTTMPAPSAVAGAENSAVTGDTPITKENYEEVMEAKSREYDKTEWKKVSLDGYSCGDNCYVEYSPHIEGGGDMTALCSAKICDEWASAGELPAALKGKTAEVKFGTAPRIDGSGKKVDNYENITEMRFLK